MAKALTLESFTNELRNFSSIPEVFTRLSGLAPERITYRVPIKTPSGEKTFKSVTYSEVSKQIYRLARYLSSIGVKEGSRVAIISYTRPEWLIADLAILFVGGTSVSVYHSVNAEETAYILYDSEVSICFAENEEQVDKLQDLSSRSIRMPATEEKEAQDQTVKISKVITFEEEGELKNAITLRSILEDASISDEYFKPSNGNEIASLVYTSGTTGPPKGVIQTHKNHIANLWQATKTELFAPTGDIFLFLPLAHSFARLIGYIGFLTPTVIQFPGVCDPRSSKLDVPSVLADLRDLSPQVVPMVPRILEKLKAGVEEKMRHSKLLSLAVQAHQQRYAARKRGHLPSVANILLSILTSPIVKIVKKKLFGSHFLHIVSGGAKLPVDVNEFFQAIGVNIYEGYGLTETCVATNVNRIGKNKIGSVGPAMLDLEMKILEDGEIAYRGPNIAKGYLNRKAATDAVWDKEGWFHTGDLGSIDDDGYLAIVGRKKELIVTSGGKKIPPSTIEEKLTNNSLISGAVLVGDAKPYCAALLVLDKLAVTEWAKSKKVTIPSKLSESQELVKELYSFIESVNESLSKFETVKKFRIIDDELTVENGFLTPTFKLKRGLVTKRYQNLIEEMYCQ